MTKKLTPKQFDALPECKGAFVLWIDPKDKRCGWVLGDDGLVEWTIGKGRLSPEGRWDLKAKWVLCRQHRDAGLHDLRVPVTKGGRTYWTNCATGEECDPPPPKPREGA